MHNQEIKIQSSESWGLHIPLACMLWFCLGSAAVHADPKARESQKKDGFELKIIRVEKKKLLQSDFERMPDVASRIIAKWLITTELTNTAKTAKLLLANPYYCATVRGLIEHSVFLPQSRMPIVSEAHDFTLLQPSGKLQAKHVVLAIHDKNDEKFYLYGYFDSIASIQDKNQLGQFNFEWSLKPFSAENEFNLSIVLLGASPIRSEEVLGKDAEKVWLGEVMSNPVTLRIVESQKN